jgi:restart primosome assembly protein PriC
VKTARLLQTLEQQLAELRRQVMPLADHTTLSPRFDRQLFHTSGTRLRACLDETDDNLQALRQAVEEERLPQVAWLAERLACQMAAISREAASWSLRGWDSPSPGIARWQQKRLQHQEFERRLLEMKTKREQRLAQTANFDQQQQLLREVQLYAERLARCRQALSAIDARLARMTR